MSEEYRYDVYVDEEPLMNGENYVYITLPFMIKKVEDLNKAALIVKSTELYKSLEHKLIDAQRSNTLNPSRLFSPAGFGDLAVKFQTKRNFNERLRTS